MDTDLKDQLFGDERVGPCKPGCAFYKLLGKGPPLNVPIPDTLVIRYNSVKCLFHEPSKGAIQQKILRFDHGKSKDEFIQNGIKSYIAQSKPLMEQAEPIYSRFVAVHKRPVIKEQRTHINQQSYFLLPVALQVQLVEIADNNLPPCVIQKFIKSRGRKPCVYRLFWKRSGMETGIAEGWNITKYSDQFMVPDIISLERPSSNSLVDGQNQEENQFKSLTTKFIASYIRAGEIQKEKEEDYQQSQERSKDPIDQAIDKLTEEVESMTFKAFAAPIAKQSILRASFRNFMDSMDLPSDALDRAFFATRSSMIATDTMSSEGPVSLSARRNISTGKVSFQQLSVPKQGTSSTLSVNEQNLEEDGLDRCPGDMIPQDEKGSMHLADYFHSHSSQEIDE